MQMFLIWYVRKITTHLQRCQFLLELFSVSQDMQPCVEEQIEL